MKTITIVAEDRIGLLADISYILGKEKINIESIAVNTVGGKAIISITVKDAKKAIDVLRKNGFSVVSEDAIVLKLIDQPGELSKVAKLLADNKISIRNVYVISKGGGYAVVGLIVDRPRKATRILEEYLIENCSEC